MVIAALPVIDGTVRSCRPEGAAREQTCTCSDCRASAAVESRSRGSAQRSSHRGAGHHGFRCRLTGAYPTYLAECEMTTGRIICFEPVERLAGTGEGH